MSDDTIDPNKGLRDIWMMSGKGMEVRLPNRILAVVNVWDDGRPVSEWAIPRWKLVEKLLRLHRIKLLIIKWMLHVVVSLLIIAAIVYLTVVMVLALHANGVRTPHNAGFAIGVFALSCLLVCNTFIHDRFHSKPFKVKRKGRSYKFFLNYE